MARVVSVVHSALVDHTKRVLLWMMALVSTRSKPMALSTVGLVMALIFHWPGKQQQQRITAPLRTDGGLRVISYNAQFLPVELLNKRGKGSYRAVQVVKRVLAYDVIGLNEIFHSKRRQELLDYFQQAWGPDFSYVVSHPDDRSAFGLDSGLMLASRLPIVESHSLVFGNDSTFRERGILNDGFAKKGALHARIRRDTDDGEMLIDCFLTHLESKDVVRRREQYSKLAAFIREHSRPDVPIILMGDFNTIGDQVEVDNTRSQYHRMCRELATARSNWLDLGLLTGRAAWGTRDAGQPSGGNRIDYIFVSNPNSEVALESVQARSLRFPDPEVGFLSDHCAVEAIFN